MTYTKALYTRQDNDDMWMSCVHTCIVILQLFVFMVLLICLFFYFLFDTPKVFEKYKLT